MKRQLFQISVWFILISTIAVSCNRKDEVVTNNSQIIHVFAGGGQSFVIKADNSLWACGDNLNGQLGDGTTVSKQNFVKVADDVKFVTTGKYYPYGTMQMPDNVPVGYSKIVKTDNTLWEAGNYFELATVDYRIPSRLIFTKNADNVKLAIRGYIIKTDNTLWEGDAMIADSVAAVSIGESGQVLIIRTDNSLWAKWGNQGTYGNGTVESSTSFIKILDNAKQISTGMYFTLLLKTDNTLWATGTCSGTFDNGFTPQSTFFKKIEDSVKSVVSSGSYGITGSHRYVWSNHSMIIKTDNTLWDIKSIYLRATPILSGYTKISDDVKEVAIGWSNFLYLKSDNSLWDANGIRQDSWTQ